MTRVDSIDCDLLICFQRVGSSVYEQDSDEKFVKKNCEGFPLQTPNTGLIMNKSKLDCSFKSCLKEN